MDDGPAVPVGPSIFLPSLLLLLRLLDDEAEEVEVVVVPQADGVRVGGGGGAAVAAALQEEVDPAWGRVKKRHSNILMLEYVCQICDEM